MKNCILLTIVLLFSSTTFALTIKIAHLAPEGSTWANMVKEMAKDIKDKTNGEIKFKTYLGGISGDESDVMRKIRVGQLHGGIFTGRTLGQINGDARIIEIPFNFYNDREKAIKTLYSMTDFINKGFEKNGMKNLGFYELGLAYLVSTKKIENIGSLKGIKIWSWDGDELVKVLMQTMELVSVPLTLPDVLSSLSTGVVDAAYNSPVGTLALQWQTKIKYIVNYPVSFGISAFLLDMKTWNKIKPEHQKIIIDSGVKFSKKANERTNEENKIALKTMKDMGITFIDFPKSDYAKSAIIRENVIKKLTGKLISKEAIKELNRNIKNK